VEAAQSSLLPCPYDTMCLRRGATRQEALLRHLRARGDPAGAPEYHSELNEQRAGDRLKQDLINLAGKRLVSPARMFCPAL
jgi:hypothetical protein